MKVLHISLTLITFENEIKYAGERALTVVVVTIKETVKWNKD